MPWNGIELSERSNDSLALQICCDPLHITHYTHTMCEGIEVYFHKMIVFHKNPNDS